MENMKHKGTFLFDNVSLNEVKAYDRTTAIFSAPSDGIYYFPGQHEQKEANVL